MGGDFEPNGAAVTLEDCMSGDRAAIKVGFVSSSYWCLGQPGVKDLGSYLDAYPGLISLFQGSLLKARKGWDKKRRKERNRVEKKDKKWEGQESG